MIYFNFFPFHTISSQPNTTHILHIQKSEKKFRDTYEVGIAVSSLSALEAMKQNKPPHQPQPRK